MFAKIGEAISQNFRLLTDRDAVFDNNVMGAIPKPYEIEPRYLFRVLQSLDLYAYATKTTVPALRKSELARIGIPVPDRCEQVRIAGILDKADAIRRKRKEAIALTDDLLRSAFVDVFGDPLTNPMGWPVELLGDIADAISGVAKGKRYNGEAMIAVPYMRVANVQDGHLRLDEVKTIVVSEGDARRYLLQSGDVLLTEGGDPDKLGRGAMWRDEIPGCIHQNHIFRVRSGPRVLPEYLGAIVSTDYGKRYFLRAAKQTTGIATINLTQLRRFPVPVPPLERQRAYADVLQRVRCMAARLEQGRDSAGELFASLADRSFGGRLEEAAV